MTKIGSDVEYRNFELSSPDSYGKYVKTAATPPISTLVLVPPV
jgi:hypothetical protein